MGLLPKHKIEIEDLETYCIEHEIAFSIGSGENKRLLLKFYPKDGTSLYRVFWRGDGEESSLIFLDFVEAMKEYNRR